MKEARITWRSLAVTAVVLAAAGGGGLLTPTAHGQDRSFTSHCITHHWNLYRFQLPRPQHVDIAISMVPQTGRQPAMLVAVYDERQRNERLKRQLYSWTKDRLFHLRTGLPKSRYSIWIGCTQPTAYRMNVSIGLPTNLFPRGSVSGLERIDGVPEGLDHSAYLARIAELMERLETAEEAAGQ